MKWPTCTIRSGAPGAPTPTTTSPSQRLPGSSSRLWELEYESNPPPYNVTSGTFSVQGLTASSPEVVAAQSDLTLGQGKQELALFLNGLPTPGRPDGSQGLIAPESLNFTDQPRFSTTPTPTNVTLGGTPPTLTDTAYLEGDNDPTGNITFTLYQGSSLLDTETVPVNGNGQYTTPIGYTLPISGAVTGTYQWNASYSGDANNDPANDIDDPTEEVMVCRAKPVLSTKPNPTFGSPPLTLLDTATLANGYYPTGTITFTLSLGSTLVDTETVAVDGNGTYSTQTGYTALTAGTYQWDAIYSGDANNDPANDIGNRNELVSVPGPVLSTMPDPTSVTLSSTTPTLTDTADLEGGDNPTGTITFTLYQGSSLLDTEMVPVNGNGTYSTEYTPPPSTTVTGPLQWNATYSGDTNNNSVSDIDDPTEKVMIRPGISTIPNPTFGASPVTLMDIATLARAYDPTGTITFTLYLGSTLVDTETVPVNGNGQYTTPIGYTVPAGATGMYQWNATYSGDTNNISVSDIDESNEQVGIATFWTAPSPSLITLASLPPTLTDTAYLIGDNDPTGTITFTLDLDSTLVYTETVAVNGDGTYSTGYTLPTSGTVIGTYQWNATYSGDANNEPASDIGNPNEQVVVKKAISVLSTTPAYGSSPVTMLDTATLNNGYYPTGTITFTLSLGTTLVDTETVAVNGNGTYSTPKEYTALTSGAYQWNATYSGDANNEPATEIDNTKEQVTIPVLSTLPNPSQVTPGSLPTTLSDTAYLIGDNDPTGTITFTLFLGTTLLDTETVAVNGNGAYSTHTGYTLPTSGTVTGTYQWNATYSGDANNEPASDIGNPNEQVIIPVLSTLPIPPASRPAVCLRLCRTRRI